MGMVSGNIPMESPVINGIPDPFFAFPDGVLHYSCMQCNARCCLNAGIILDVRRDMELLQFYPILERRSLRIRDTFLSISSSPCDLLDNDGLCRIQKDHGERRKPEVCLLYPFGQFHECGGIRIIIPNYACHFEIKVPAQPGRVEGSHSLLRDRISNSAAFHGQHPNRHPIYGLHPTETVASFLRHQKSLLDACSEGLGKRSFFETLTVCSNGSKSLEGFLARALGVLGISQVYKAASSDRVDILLHIVVSTITLSMPGLAFDGRIRAMALGEVLLRQLFSLNQGRENLHNAYKFLIDIGSGIRLLARYTDMLSLPVPEKGTVMIPSHTTYAPFVLAAYAVVAQTQKRKPAIDALAHAMDMNIQPGLRLAFLAELGEWIEYEELKRIPLPILDSKI